MDLFARDLPCKTPKSLTIELFLSPTPVSEVCPGGSGSTLSERSPAGCYPLLKRCNSVSNARLVAVEPIGLLVVRESLSQITILFSEPGERGPCSRTPRIGIDRFGEIATS